MGLDRTVAAQAPSPERWSRPAALRRSSGTQRHSVNSAFRRALERSTGAVPLIPDLPPALPAVGRGLHLIEGAAVARRRPAKSQPNRYRRMLRRRYLRECQKGGAGAGKTKRGKGSKFMAVAGRAGLPIAVSVGSASPNEVKLVEATPGARFIAEPPERLIGDKAYDSEPLDQRLAEHRIEIIAPHRDNRKKARTQDGRPLRRYRKRWRIERLFASLQNFRRLITRHEHKTQNWLGFVHPGCIFILMRQYFETNSSWEHVRLDLPCREDYSGERHTADRKFCWKLFSSPRIFKGYVLIAERYRFGENTPIRLCAFVPPTQRTPVRYRAPVSSMARQLCFRGYL